MAVVLAVAIVAVTFLAVAFLLLRQHGAESAAWAAERRELLNRIQHPEVVVTPSVEHFELPDPEPDERELVGTITFENEDSPDA